MLKGFMRPLRLPVSALQSFARRKMSGMTLPKCPKFVSLEAGDDMANIHFSGPKFRLVSYNILAQVYVKSSFFPHSPSPSLKWKARSQAILTVLKSFKADFLCIQELDEYDSFYKAKMGSLGYSSMYVQRTGQKRDGCGIFYKHDSAELVLTEEIDYNGLVKSIDNGAALSEIDDDLNATSTEGSSQKRAPDGHGDLNDPRVRLKRDCVGILAAFKLNDPSHPIIIVANTHIYWDPELADVKLAQANYLLLRLDKFRAVVSERFNCKPPVLVAGDFNSTPGDKVYQRLVSGSTSTLMQQGETEEKSHLSLCSLHAFIGGEPPFTNYTPGFVGTLDYIFFTPSSGLKPVSSLEIPGPESPDIVGGLPNYQFPSDHLPIGADFIITST
ncbi:hypothetical protein QJS10_CPB20g01082 [Acorus calamus]|uniref:Endonuclease/exonuclease/phosphatase domain-containing protein n=1 Tax=Acorus calamus TaxID=4465 RepID=A0AAV9C7W4_ACOCL|nr:hypothetical protein QJS10_CPB20g01082 [Acorus calamus]